MEDGGWSWRRQDGGPPASHLYCCCLFVLGFLFFFLHSLLSIKKPFLQPVSEAHSLLLSINDASPSPLHIRRNRVPSRSLAWGC